MKAISLTQPWANLMAWGEKRNETRSWRTSYTGPLAIHASKGFPGWAKQLCEDWPFADVMVRNGFGMYVGPTCGGWIGDSSILHLGAVVAVVTLVKCIETEIVRMEWARDGIPNPREQPYLLTQHEYEFGDYSKGRWAWITRDVIRLPEPVPCKGALGLWELPLDVEQEVTRQLGLARAGYK